MNDDETKVRNAAGAVIASGWQLAFAIFDRLSSEDRASWLAFEAAGAEAALTMKWAAASDGPCMELRLGFVQGDASAVFFTANLPIPPLPEPSVH